MHLKVSHITHILCFVLGCSFTLLLMSYQLKDHSGYEIFEKEEYRLVVIIISSPDNVEQRAAIRETWASDFDDKTQYVFVIGKLDIDSSIYSIIHSEQTAHGDILLLPVHDTYSALTKKVLAAILNVASTYKFQFLLKVDDDTFVNVKKLNEALKQRDSNLPMYWGYFNGRASVFKKGKWKEDDWFLCDRYLPYALGGGYILTLPVVQYIVTNAHLLSLYKSEDVSLGTWLAPLNITRIHDTRFDSGYKSRGCQNSHILSHKQSPVVMRALHSSLTHTGQLCAVETELMKPYEYDWSAPPSRCCARLALSSHNSNFQFPLAYTKLPNKMH